MERLVERLERVVFFRITRFVVWVMLVASGVALLVSLAVLGMATVASFGSTRVTPDEVRRALAGVAPAPTPTPAQRTARRETRGERRVRVELERTLALFPREAREGGGVHEVLELWLAEYERPSERITFLGELRAVLEGVPSERRVEASNVFRDLKEERLEEASAQRNLGFFFQLANVRGAVASLGLLALFTLVLVVLTIERTPGSGWAPAAGRPRWAGWACLRRRPRCHPRNPMRAHGGRGPGNP